MSSEQSLRDELTRLRVRYVEVRRERNYARQALGFYADPANWLFRHDPRGGVRQSEAAEDRGMFARSVLKEVSVAEGKATEDPAV